MSYPRLLVTEILIRWNQLVPADLDGINDERRQLVELLQARYGVCRDRAEREVDSFMADFGERLRRAVVA